MLHTLAISNYRSIRDLVLPLDQLNLVTGSNGSGKSNLYRGLRLICDAAYGNVIRDCPPSASVLSLWSLCQLPLTPDWFVLIQMEFSQALSGTIFCSALCIVTWVNGMPHPSLLHAPTQAC